MIFLSLNVGIWLERIYEGAGGETAPGRVTEMGSSNGLCATEVLSPRKRLA